MNKSSLPEVVQIRAFARLHMGFLDLHGGLGRQFGSLGLTLDAPSTVLQAHRTSGFTANGPCAEQVLRYAHAFAAHVADPVGGHFELTEAIPRHAGLGSGTQLALCVGTALARLHGLVMTTTEIALACGRGTRSGIGIGAFDQGGLLLDGGRGVLTGIPPILARLSFPAPWRVLLLFDTQASGVHGEGEIAAFQALPEFSAETAAALCHRVLMQALPAVMEADLLSFGAAIYELQCRVGDHFAPAQGGCRYASPVIADALAWLYAQGVSCVGQSSWGPTGFAVLPDEISAQHYLQVLRQRYASHTHILIQQCCHRDRGSEVRVI